MKYIELNDAPRAVWYASWTGSDQQAAEAAYAAIVLPFPSLNGSLTPKVLISLAQGQIGFMEALDGIIGDDEAMLEWQPQIRADTNSAEIRSHNGRLTVTVSIWGGVFKISAQWATPSPTHLDRIQVPCQKAGVELNTLGFAEFSAELREASSRDAYWRAAALAHHGEWEEKDGRVTARTYRPVDMYNMFCGLDC